MYRSGYDEMLYRCMTVFHPTQRYNFSTPFVLEDRLLLVRLYNKYTQVGASTGNSGLYC